MRSRKQNSNSKTIPIHDFAGKLYEPKFDVDLWRHKFSGYDVSLPHRHNYFEVLVFLKGGGEHEIDFNSYKIKSNALHFVHANQVHVVKRARGSSGFTISFAEEFLPLGVSVRDFDFFKAVSRPVLNPPKKDFTEILSVLDAIKAEFFSQQKNKREALQALLQIFLIKAKRLHEAASGSQPLVGKSVFSERMEQLVEEKFQHHWRAGDYARELNMSVMHLHSLCKHHFSKSTETLIQDRLLLEIKRLLVYSDKSVKEIGYDLNFDDPAYFIRLFKKHTGITPLEYRKSVNR